MLKVLNISLIILCSQVVNGIQMTDCIEKSEPTLCYHCDSLNDSYCGEPFQFSHYYGSKDVYLTECQSCCIKILHPMKNGTQRIQRSCTELLPDQLSFYLEENCSGNTDVMNICLCQRGLCNNADFITHIPLLPTFLTMFWILNFYINP